MEKEIIEFLKGNHDYVKELLKKQMNDYSEKMEYEKALEIKEMLDYIEITLTRQKVEINDSIDRDVIGYYEFKGYLSIQIFFIRSGKIQERISKTIPLIDEINEELTSLNNRNTWEISNKKENVNCIGSKWVYKVKTYSTGKKSKI